MKNADRLIYIKLEDDLFWSSSCQGFAFGEIINDFRIPDLQTTFVRNGKMYSIFDSASATIQMPDPIFEPFIREIFEKAGGSPDDFKLNYGSIISKCYDTFPALHFMFDKIWLTVNVEDYVIDVSEAQDRSQCYLLITKGELPFLVLGLPIFNGYYMVHDDVNGRLGFAAGIRSSKKDPQWGTVPTNVFSDKETQKDWQETKEQNEEEGVAEIWPDDGDFINSD